MISAKHVFCLIAASAAVACGTHRADMALLPAAAFEAEVDGLPVSLYTLRGGGLAMQVTNYGARVVSLWTPDCDGRYEDVVLGYESLDRYLHNEGERFLGAVVGPVANRIGAGAFTLDGEAYVLPRNDHGQTLHGGLRGLDRVVWDVVEATGDRLVLHYLHRDGEEGFPGNLDIEMTYSLTPDDEFRIDYRATTDKATPVNISHHSFFNLKGEGNGTVLDNELTINAGRFTPVDSVLIPTGELASVECTPFDFRVPHAIGERIGADDVQLRNGGGYDLNWAIDRKSPDGLELAARVYEPTTGRTLEVWSDQPGLQFYSGNFFDGATTGKYGRPLRFRESLALETQRFPDGPNRPEFPSTILRPGETYTHTCVYRFGVQER
ncbi:MAG: galactose mutarotase [Alistipes sp.]|nr:galactose mutarotase [Alistipes sp.]